MRKTLLVVGVSLVFAACANKSPTAPVTTRVALHTGESGQVGADVAEITFVRVDNDSRCATDVVCVAAGNAIVLFTVAFPGGGPQALALQSLNTTDEPRSLVLGDYRFTLDSLLPRPLSTKVIGQDEYVAYISAARAR